MRGLALKKRLLPLVLGVLLIISMTGCGNVEAGLPYSGNRMIYLQSADNGMAGGFLIVALIQQGQEQAGGLHMFSHGFSPFLTVDVVVRHLHQYSTDRNCARKVKI